MSDNSIHWPDQFHPDKSAIHVVNSLDLDVPSEKVWNCLIRATEWPSYYNNASNVRILSGAQQQLELGTRFRWKTFGVTIETTVKEYEPFERLAWEASSFGMKVYHAWLITPTSTGCHVQTEETQNGILPRIGALLRPGDMHRQHQKWL